MITLDFSWGISLYFFFGIAVTVSAWLLRKKGRNKDLSLDPKCIWFCAVCTYTYINTKEEVISVCPRCGCYNKKPLPDNSTN